MTDFAGLAARLDAADPLAQHRDAFVEPDGVVAYLDGNSLGRPLHATRQRLTDFVDGPWGDRLIRSWDEQWMRAPVEVGDRIAAICLGAAPGQTIVGDSTTVMLYKLVRAAVDLAGDRGEIVVDTGNFPTDRFVVEGVAAERGLRVVWIEAGPVEGVQLEDVQAVLGSQTALVLLSHVAFRSGAIADLPEITAAVHEAGALMLWDLCHSVGAVEVGLDQHGVDFAVGCTYKYLNGGPGAPAFGYVAERLHGVFRQPVQGWMGAADPFTMGPDFEPAAGIRRLVSGTPSILAMQPMQDMLDLIERAGMVALRTKSVALTELAIEMADETLAEHGVVVSSPRDADRRGSHVLLEHPAFQQVTAALWEVGIIPDFRPPTGLRVGLSPLSTSFREVVVGLDEVRRLLGN